MLSDALRVCNPSMSVSGLAQYSEVARKSVASEFKFSDRCLTADGIHGPRRRNELRAVDFMPDPFFAYGGTDRVRNLMVRCAIAQQRFHVRLFNREQTV